MTVIILFEFCYWMRREGFEVNCKSIKQTNFDESKLCTINTCPSQLPALVAAGGQVTCDQISQDLQTKWSNGDMRGFWQCY